MANFQKPAEQKGDNSVDNSMAIYSQWYNCIKEVREGIMKKVTNGSLSLPNKNKCEVNQWACPC